MESEETLMMFGKAADFNREMYQINIASMDVLMHLVQVVDSMREAARRWSLATRGARCRRHLDGRWDPWRPAARTRGNPRIPALRHASG